MLQAKQWLTVQEVADELDVTDGRVRQWLLRPDDEKGAKLRGTKFGNTWAISRDDLREFMKQERRPGNPNFSVTNTG